MKVRQITRKAMDIKFSGRSSDYLSPTIGHGCLLKCTYCYMKRHKPEGLDYAKNINEILEKIDQHSLVTDIKKPNQTDPEFITYDIACNEDFALHSNKYYNWKNIFTFFKEHPRVKATLATKIIPEHFLDFNPRQKVRIRFSMMPQHISDIVEPHTAKTSDKIEAIDKFIEAGYEVHINFSPVIVTNSWEEDYKQLFTEISNKVKNKDKVKCEVIFLTHNEDKHKYNLEHNLSGEDLLWLPELQEEKISSYGGKNIRYKYQLKYGYVNKFKNLHSQIIPWNKIRYIF